MNPTLEQLARYVVQELERGVPEVTLYAALRESGWTQDWISAAFSTAKQRAVPDNPGHMSFPAVQHHETQAAPSLPAIGHSHSTRPQPVIPQSQVQAQPNPSVQRQKTATDQPRSMRGLKRTLIIVIAVLSVVVLGLGVYRTINGIQHQAEQRVVRDADRREDLSVLLSNLSDYFLTHHSYPTRTQLNTASFLKENGFSEDSIADPQWKKSIEACTKDGRPILAGVLTPGCYLYEVKTEQNGICNNGSAACTKVKVTIWLEVDKKPYAVTFDKNAQAN